MNSLKEMFQMTEETANFLFRFALGMSIILFIVVVMFYRSRKTIKDIRKEEKEPIHEEQEPKLARRFHMV